MLYISTGTRLDISYNVNYLSRFQNCCDKTHFKYALRILKYLYFTRDIKLTYKRDINKEIIDCYVDADWASDAIDRKSTTGYIIRMFENVIYWKTRKQGSVTKSSTCRICGIVRVRKRDQSNNELTEKLLSQHCKANKYIRR